MRGARKRAVSGRKGVLCRSALREGVQRLEITTRVTLGVLALASGVYTYLGVRDLLNGNATIVFFAAVIYAVAVSIGIYAFWTFLIRFLPHVTERKSRGLSVRLHGARLGHDHRDVGLAECLGARRRSRNPAASCSFGAGLYPRSRPRTFQCARGTKPRSGYPDGGDTLLEACRSRARRLADRHVRVRHRGATPDPDVDAAREPRQGSDGLRRARQDVLRAGRQTSCEDARTRLRRAVRSTSEAMLSGPRRCR